MRLNFGNSCYNLVQNLSSSHLLSKNLRIGLYKIIILPLFLYGCETWSLTFREKHRVFGGKVLRKMIGPRRDEVMI
jgi:hypothetical protein